MDRPRAAQLQHPNVFPRRMYFRWVEVVLLPYLKWMEGYVEWENSWKMYNGGACLSYFNHCSRQEPAPSAPSMGRCRTRCCCCSALLRVEEHHMAFSLLGPTNKCGGPVFCLSAQWSSSTGRGRRSGQRCPSGLSSSCPAPRCQRKEGSSAIYFTPGTLRAIGASCTRSST